VHDGAVIPSPDDDRRAVGMSGQGGASGQASATSGQARATSGALEILTARLRLQPVAQEDLEELYALHADPRAFAEDLTAPLTDRAQMRWVLGRWRESWEHHGVGYLTVRARDAADEEASSGAAMGAARRADGGIAGAVGDGGEAGLPPAVGDAAAVSTPPAVGPPLLWHGLLGVVGLSPLELEDGPALSAYWRLSPDATGHGIATEAMRAVLASPQLTSPAITTAEHSTAGLSTAAPSTAGRGGDGAEIVAVTAAGNHRSRTLAARLGFTPAPPERPVPGGREGDVLLIRTGS
jgi:RimJ/RimL family protein N-acetyltransferase